MPKAPIVMVSSTFYDLKQLRRDLAGFLVDDMGYVPLLSELPSFPIDPDADTVTNCQRRVEKDADVLVLVVGGRYGSVDARSAKSVTNLEFLAAQAKGIPIFVFIERGILSIMPVWQANPAGDYSNVVDTPALFEFIKSIRDEQKVWVSPFETANEIIEILRIQFAYRFLAGLNLDLRIRGAGMPTYLEGAGADTLRIALEKPPAWEFKLLFHSWQDEVERRSWKIRDHRTKIGVGFAEDVTASNAPEWMQTRIHELTRMTSNLNDLLNVEWPIAYGKPGEPADPDRIVWITKRIGDILDFALDWSQRVRRARVGSPFSDVAAEMPAFVARVIEEIADNPKSQLALIEAALLRVPTEGPQTLTFTLTISVGDLDNFHKALNRAKQHYGIKTA